MREPRPGRDLERAASDQPAERTKAPVAVHGLTMLLGDGIVGSRKACRTGHPVAPQDRDEALAIIEHACRGNKGTCSGNAADADRMGAAALERSKGGCEAKRCVAGQVRAMLAFRLIGSMARQL